MLLDSSNGSILCPAPWSPSWVPPHNPLSYYTSCIVSVRLGHGSLVNVSGRHVCHFRSEALRAIMCSTTSLFTPGHWAGSVPDPGCCSGPRKSWTMKTMEHEQEVSISCWKPLWFGDHQPKLYGKEVNRWEVLPNPKIWDSDFVASKWVARSQP